MNQLNVLCQQKGYDWNLGFHLGEYVGQVWKWKTYRNLGKICPHPKCKSTIIDAEMLDIKRVGGSNLEEVIKELLEYVERL